MNSFEVGLDSWKIIFSRADVLRMKRMGWVKNDLFNDGTIL